MRKGLLFVLILFGAVLLGGCSPQSSTDTTPQGSGEGRVVFAITDAAADLGTISIIQVTVDSVQVHSATEGWVTVSSTPKTYDLLKLKADGSNELLADINLKEGTYKQLRLNISKVLVTDATGEQEAKLPSGELKIVGDLVVNVNSTSTATFDFIADESLHVTGQGKYIMAPVVKLETRDNADVEVKSDNKVEIKTGNIKTNVKVGMDANGNVGAGLGIKADEELEIDNGAVKIKLTGGSKSSEESNNTPVSAGASFSY